MLVMRCSAGRVVVGVKDGSGLAVDVGIGDGVKVGVAVGSSVGVLVGKGWKGVGEDVDAGVVTNGIVEGVAVLRSC